MTYFRTGMSSCIEHERLTFELLEVRTRGQYLTRLRNLSREERAEWDRREQTALANLVDHDLGHGCSLLKTRSGERGMQVRIRK